MPQTPFHRLHGLVAATHTPFHADRSLNLAIVEKQAAHLLGTGVGHAFIGGTTGESSSLTLEERRALAVRWLEVTRGSALKVIVHVGANCLSDACVLAAQAQQLGAAAVSALAPSYFKPGSVATLVGSMAQIAAAAPELPFYYYEIPKMTGIALAPSDFLSQAVERIPNLAGIKLTSSNLMEYQLCRESHDGRFDVPFGFDEMLLAALALGATGAVGSSFNFAAPIYLRIMAAFQRGDLTAAQGEQMQSVRIIQKLAARGYMGAAKAVMTMLGVNVGPHDFPAQVSMPPRPRRYVRNSKPWTSSSWSSRQPDSVVSAFHSAPNLMKHASATSFVGEKMSGKKWVTGNPIFYRPSFCRFLLATLLLNAAALPAAEPFLEKQDLFTVGDNPAYNLYHIPGIVVTAKGTVLAWCEARKGGGDWSDIRILLRRSTDDGKSWSAPQSIVDVPGPKQKNPFALRLKNVDTTQVTYNNPVLIADKNGTVHMLFCLEYERAFYQRSEDDGVSWSKPVEITAAFDTFKKHYDWKVLATGPNHSIQLKTGRLVVPVWLSTGEGGNAHRPSVTATIYSDDRGETWHAGDIAVPCTEEWINPNETVAIELNDGRVMLNVRSESKAHRRLVTTSPDGATNWSTPKFDDALLEPICMAGIVRYQHDGQSLVLFSNPHNLDGGREGRPEPGKSRARKNVSIKLSRDDARTWPVNKLLEAGPGMYSDLAVTKSGTILSFYGRGTKPGFAGAALTLARFNLEWVITP